jgi:hypothetical protein
MVYVKPTVRKSLLAKMLTELLDTRVMVKEGMKLAKGNKVVVPTMPANDAANTPGEAFATCLGRSTVVPQIYLVSSNELQDSY